jgi:hypothetical protein
MSRRRRSALLGLTLAAGLAIPLGLTPVAGASKGADIEVVAHGLRNPRGLDLSHRGDLYVTEAGRGGGGPCIRTSAGVDECLGRTGAITVVEDGDGHQHKLARLPSIADQTTGGARAIGPSDIDFHHGKALVTVGLAADPALRDDLGARGRLMGRVLSLSHHGELAPVADIAAFESAENPDGGQPGAAVDTNPNSVLFDRHGVFVADAGGNSLLQIHHDGSVSTVAVFRFRSALAPDFLGLPPGTEIPLQPVPTSVTRGPDGALYVGELTGFPFPEGAARVWRIVPGQRPHVYARGFTHISDLGFDDEGNLYVLQLGTASLLGDLGPGALIRVDAHGHRSEIAKGRLTFPMGLAIEDDDEFFVSDRGDSPGRGRVLHIELDD